MEHQAHICLSLPFAANVLVQTPPVAIASLASFMFSYSLAFLTPFLHTSTLSLYSFQGNFFLLLPSVYFLSAFEISQEFPFIHAGLLSHLFDFLKTGAGCSFALMSEYITL